MNILIAIEDLRTGGAQVFGMRLAQALHERRHSVYLYSHYAAYINYPLVKQIAPDVPVLTFESKLPGFDWLLLRVQGALRRLGRPFAWREAWVARHLRRTLEHLKIDVLNSHMIKSDYVAAEAAATARPAVPLVITMHGCYEEFLHKSSEPEVTLKSREALRQAAGVVYLTDKNLEIFSVPGVRPLAGIPHAQIYNGFAGKFSSQLPTRAQLGIGEHDLVFGMIARGIPQKGWQYAISSFDELNARQPNTHLLLVGSSEYLDQLRGANTNAHIHFVGFAPNPIDWARLFDVGLLPSYFPSESLPNCIAECLFCGVPMIATRIGEIPAMLTVAGQGLAGMLLEQNGQGITEPAALTAAMRAYATSPGLLQQHRAWARQAYQKFDMDACVEAYLTIFRESLASSTPN